MPKNKLKGLQSAGSGGVMTGVQGSQQLGLASFMVLSADLERLELFSAQYACPVPRPSAYRSYFRQTRSCFRVLS